MELFEFATDLANGLPVSLATEPGDVIRIAIDHLSRTVGVRPSTIEFTDTSGVVRTVTSAIPDPDFPTVLSEENFAAMTTRATFGIGGDLDSRVRPA